MRKPPIFARCPPALALVLLLGLGACADRAAERTLAGQTSTQLVLHQTQVRDFIDAQSDLNKADALELDRYAQLTAILRDNSARLTEAWTLAANQPLLDQQASATSVGPAAIISSMAIDTTAAAKLSDGGAGDALDGANKTLTTLALTPSNKDRAVEVFGLASDVNTALTSIQKDAVDKTQANAATATKNATPKPANP